MEAKLYNSFLSNFLEIQKSKPQLLENREAPHFNVFPFATRDISELQYDTWAKELTSFGIDNKSAVLYYFRITSEFNPNEIRSTIRKLKMSPGKSERALPKINEEDASYPRNILYVGKTNSNFPVRFKQHLGLGAPTTYALHLVHWARQLNLDLELHVSKCHFQKDKIHVLEMMEGVLHDSLKPILGRPGH